VDRALSVRGPLRVLCLNGGSSSLKFALVAVGETEERLAAGAIERLGSPHPRLWMRDGAGRGLVERAVEVAAGAAAVAAVLDVVAPPHLPAPDAVGHRVVHGGPHHVAPARVDAALLAGLRGALPFAPLHLPAEIAGIETVAARAPALPQVVCFDTAFHHRMPELARRLPLPRRLWDAGVRRYGCHGLSYEYVVGALGAAARGRLVIAHLGNGASMAAVRDGMPVDTTMGLTPTGGLVMATRSGDLDPGVLLHLMRAHGYDAPALERLVDLESGMLGISELSSDMATLLAARATDPRAADAVALFCASARRHVGALAAALGGLDGLVFTGGIGEHAAPVRAEICAGLAHLGVELDAIRNDRHADVISASGSRCTVRVIRTDEDVVIARHTREVLAR
jgi:acetate kinase